MFKNFSNLYQSKSGQVLIAAILGFGLATLFRRSCSGKDCIAFIAPKIKEVTANTYIHGPACYKFVPRSLECTHKEPILHKT